MRAFKNIGILAIGVAVGFFISGMMEISEATPGSESDPLVTLSYVDKRFEELDTYIESKLEEKSDVSESQNAGALFEIVEVNAGSMVYLGDSTEVIVRSGEALAIASSNGGLADLTEGYNIEHGKKITNNHHILNPQNDGRGIAITQYGWIMVKGPYTVVEN